MARQRKRRTRTAHPGVKLLRKVHTLRDGTAVEAWHARYVNPETGKVEQVSLTALDKTTDESRRAWAIEKSESLRERKAAVAAGAVVRTQTTIAAALADFYEEPRADGKPHSRLNNATLTVYKQATTPFAAWCANNGVPFIESLTSPKLVQFRAHFVARPAHEQAAGHKRGQRKEGKRRRSAAQINKCLRSLRTVVSTWRKLGKTPGLDSDAIRDALEFARAQKPLPKFLKAKQCRALLEAAMRHDLDTFTFVHRGESSKPLAEIEHHYTPIAPFIVVGLLSGMRFSEVANLRWKDIDFDGDGEIALQSDRTKTGHGRKIGLRESPALKALLENMKLRAGGSEYVWGSSPYRRDLAEAARKRLVKEYGAPAFTWHDLRRTAGTFLTCAPSIYGAASAFLSAKRLGHSVVVSEKHYAGAVTIAPEHKTLEAALGIADSVEAMAGNQDVQTVPRLLRESA